MSTGYYTHEDCRKHEMGRGHPERPERLDAITDLLIGKGVIDGLVQIDAPLVDFAHVELAHTPSHVQNIQDLHDQLCVEVERGTGSHIYIDPDTSMNTHSLNAFRRAAGAAVAATDAVIDGKLANAFCATRPPGHHATARNAMGFCVFNNVAIAAKYALEKRGLKRVAVIDFDVHHGNGTEDILAGDERCLMLGTFQHPFYPHSGKNSLAENIFNLPVPAYTKGDVIRKMYAEDIFPKLEEFAPEMIFISAGFDAHKEDDLGQLGLVEADYAWITEELCKIADKHCKGRIVSCLEGGYNLSALARSVLAHVRVLAKI